MKKQGKDITQIDWDIEPIEWDIEPVIWEPFDLSFD
jgi:hypothetical protein